MRIISRKLLTASLLISFVFVPPAALAGYREEMRVTAVEIAQLPPFCWMQFEVPNVKGEEFRIRDCGVAANHYCPALIFLIRAKSHWVSSVMPTPTYAIPSARSPILHDALSEITSQLPGPRSTI